MVADISRWKDGLSRSFVHAQPFRSVDLIVRGEASGWWHPGAMGPGVGRVSCGAPVIGAEESRLIRRPSVSSQTKRPRLGGNCWSRGQKVRLLLESAGVEFRPSWRLRSRCTHSRQELRIRQSVVLLIAFKPDSIDCGSGVPMGLEFLTLTEPRLGRAICWRHLEHRSGRSARR